jgi:hypothetical protein
MAATAEKSWTHAISTTKTSKLGRCTRPKIVAILCKIEAIGSCFCYSLEIDWRSKLSGAPFFVTQNINFAKIV